MTELNVWLKDWLALNSWLALNWIYRKLTPMIYMQQFILFWSHQNMSKNGIYYICNIFEDMTQLTNFSLNLK